MQNVWQYLREHFLARWIVVNILSWSIGLYLGSLAVRLAGFTGILVGGALTGLTVGGAQWWALRQEMVWEDRRWITFSAVGGVLSTLLIYVASGVFLIAAFVVGEGVFRTVGALIAGGLYGGIFGTAQHLVLGDYVDSAVLWIAANVMGGALCAACSLAVNPLSLPIFCTLGPVFFGGITGYTLMRLLPRAD